MGRGASLKKLFSGEYSMSPSKKRVSPLTNQSTLSWRMAIAELRIKSLSEAVEKTTKRLEKMSTESPMERARAGFCVFESVNI